MRGTTRWTLAIAAGVSCIVAAAPLAAEPADPAVQPTTFDAPLVEPAAAARQAETARQIARGSGGDVKALAQVIQLTRGLQPAAAAQVFDELAAAHERAGDLTLAADVRRTLAARFPQEPLAAQAVLQLLRLYASSEIGFAQRAPDAARQAIAQQLASTDVQAVETTAQQNASAGSPASAAYGLHLANEAARANPTLDDDPALRFQRYVAARRTGDAKVANKFLAPLNRPTAPEPWGACARTEKWLQSRSAEQAPRPTLAAVAAKAPPQLDGTLDEPLWHGQSMAALGSAEVRLAYDEEFLYVAIRARKIAGVSYEADARPRLHDADLSQSDRVRLLIDLDRDYATWFELTIDSRGRTADRCGDDPKWNPQWYVAPGEDRSGEDRFDSTELAEVSGPDGADGWTIEAAIPFAALADAPPAPGAAWACAIERLTPNAAAQSWSGQPAPRPTPEHFGLLLFD